MHRTDHDNNAFCLTYSPISEVKSSVYQKINYCLRDVHVIRLIQQEQWTDSIHHRWSFSDLRKNNVTTEDLIKWSAPIEVAERYQMSFSTDMNESFINCSLPWFGPDCRFIFDPPDHLSFAETVFYHLSGRLQIVTDSYSTCYTHLVCEKPWSCLDWREICDSKIDCLDGSDEHHCWLLESNECAENEFRCQNGQCIPKEFFNDDHQNADCLDKSDELERNFPLQYCNFDPNFRCEEVSCRQGLDIFPCGDGNCIYPGESECSNGRGNLLSDDLCLKAIACLMKIFKVLVQYSCPSYCKQVNCTRIKETHCPTLFQFPPGPVLFGHITFVFTNESVMIASNEAILPEYICFDARKCPIFSSHIVYLLNMTCVPTQSLYLSRKSDYYNNLVNLRKRLLECSNTYNCNLPNAYQCENSTKCISKYQRYDKIQDCPFNDDEILQQNISSTFGLDDQLNSQSNDDQIYFSQICDGFPDLQPILIDNEYVTDETNCSSWPCNNTYTRCNRFWSCDNGADEINCPPSTCPTDEHSCVFFNDTTKISCLPINRAGDGEIDCLGGTDEPNICRYITPVYLIEKFFTCRHGTKCVENYELCEKNSHCPLHDDTSFCQGFRKEFVALCSSNILKTDVQNFFCDNIISIEPKVGQFRLMNMPHYGNQKIVDRSISISTSRVATQVAASSRLSEIMPKETNWRCHRGVRIQIRINISCISNACLCPPSYYGDQCQYQNDRVSLTVRFRATWNWRDIFLFVFTLTDEEQHIESHDIIEYLPIRDCDKKYNLYLQFADRRKNYSRNYSIRIDAINRLSRIYRASWIYPIQYLFLPVYRLSMIVTIPHADMEITTRCPIPCFHGQCYRYVNAPHLIFCRCNSAWGGIHCNKRIQCHCASNGDCLDDSLCLCPIDRFGPQCHLLQRSCSPGYCANDGRCVQPPSSSSSVQSDQPTCVCSEQYSGDRCQHQQSYVEVLFHRSLSIPSYVLIHFITVNVNSEPFRSSTLKKVPFDKNYVFIHVSFPFNIAIAQVLTDYYLLIIRERPIISATIVAQIDPTLRCPHIRHIFFGNIMEQHLLKRIKYYHRPCIQDSQLACFRDDMHICVCEQGRHANCFRFEHNMTFDCQGSAVCENGGQCFLDRPVCPTSGSCICPDCFYGSKCQFSTKSSSLSLDTIIGYQFTPHLNFNQQSLVVKITLCTVIVIFTLGLINNFCSLLTFRMKSTLESGCGRYLLASTITSIVNMIALVAKFWILLAWQTGSLKNTSLIYVQCVLFDYLLRLLLTTHDWLYALVAIERTMTVLQGTKFNKVKSREIAKWIIILMFFFIALTYIHEPIHREIIIDTEDQRTWCVTKYSNSLMTYNTVINILHFIFPFAINFLSGIIIIVSSSYRYRAVHKKVIFRNICLQETSNHKHLLISPFLLVLLALPRLIISFLSGCMKSGRNPWLYLIGYFISFLPPVSIFVVFVLPSTMYKREFGKSLRTLWRK